MHFVLFLLYGNSLFSPYLCFIQTGHTVSKFSEGMRQGIKIEPSASSPFCVFLPEKKLSVNERYPKSKSLRETLNNSDRIERTTAFS